MNKFSRLLPVALLTLTACLGTGPTREDMTAESWEASVEPIRPGIPGKAPFWNVKANRFIYAPAFDFKRVEGATSYRFTCIAAGTAHRFDAKVPWAPLSPVWKDIPVGHVVVEVEGIKQGKKGEEVVGVSGKRRRTARVSSRSWNV